MDTLYYLNNPVLLTHSKQLKLIHIFRKKSYKYEELASGKKPREQGFEFQHLQPPTELVPLFPVNLKSEHYALTLLLVTAEVALFHRRELLSCKDD